MVTVQLFNTYGDLSSVELLEKYGYIEPDVNNPHDEVEASLALALTAFRAQLKEDELALFEEKLKFMRENGILPDPSDLGDSDDEIAEPVGEDEIEFSLSRPSTIEHVGQCFWSLTFLCLCRGRRALGWSVELRRANCCHDEGGV